MDPVTEIKSRLDIVDIAGQYTQLKKAGRNWKGCCPFHEEKTPSFVVSQERQFAWCYGCQTGGDIFSLVQKLEGVDFREALRILAEKAGVELTNDFGGGVKKEKRDELLEINEAAAEFFVEQLTNSEEAKNYLVGRRLDDATIKKWRIGFAPDDFHSLHPVLEKSFDKKMIVEAGVASTKELASNDLFDKFRGRIVFPICDARGAVVAFTGRVIGDGEPKYLNSPESPIFKKGDILFGLHLARDTIRETKKAFVSEGQMDVVACHAAGFTNFVASSGTALTENHLKILGRIADEIIFCFDADGAGVESTKRALTLAAAADLNCRVVVLPEGAKDPDEAIEKSHAEFEKALAEPLAPLDWFFDVAFAEENLSDTPTKKRVARELLTYAHAMTSAIEREEFLRALALRLQTSEDAIRQEFSAIKIYEPRPAAADETISTTPKFDAEDDLVGLALAFPDAAKFVEEWQNFRPQKKENAEIFDFADDEKNERAEILQLRASDRYANFSDEKVADEIRKFLARLSTKNLDSRRRQLLTAIAEAENAGDDAKAAELAAEYQKLLA